MKKIVLAVALVLLVAGFNTTLAQKDSKAEKEKKETQEIIIRKKGEKDTKVTVEIKGDQVTINGKPMSEFKDDEVTISKREIIIKDGKGNMRFHMSPGDFEGMSFWNDDSEETTAFLGVTTGVFNDGTKDSKPKGAEVTDVSKGSAAEKAGLKKGDVIVKINDKSVTDPESLSEVITSFKPKDEVTVYYNRDGKGGSAKAILGERKQSKSLAYSFSGPDGMTRSFSMPRVPGVPKMDKVELWNEKERREMSPKIWTPGSGNNFEFFGDAFPRQQKLGLKVQDTEDSKGVKVLDVDKDSPAEKAGLQKDDIVTEVAGKKVSNTDEIRELLQQNKENPAYSIKASRNGKNMNFDIKIPKKLKTANL